MCAKGVSNSETGGAGTSYLESALANGTLLTQKVTVDNNGHDYPHASIYEHGDLRSLLDGNYDDISFAGGVTWLYDENPMYGFKELDVRGNAHVAILRNTNSDEIEVDIDYLWGDRSGVLHVGKQQTLRLTEVDVYLPANLAAYR